MMEIEDTQTDDITQLESQYDLDLDDSKNDLQLVAIDAELTQLAKIVKEDPSPDFTISDEKQSIIRSISSESSDHDPFSHLPPNWINFDFKRKKSCLLSSIYSTCVTKAINHLESLQNAIDNWSVNIDRALTDSVATSESSKRIMDFTRRKIPSKSVSQRSELRFVSFETPKPNDMLEINGRGAEKADYTEKTLDIFNKKDLVVQERKEPLQDLLVGGVLEEILLLLGRLEFDRRRTELLLNNEKANFNKLHKKIEDLGLQRAVELPFRVQKEHEACITDITELNWHISFNTKAERKLIRKVEIDELMHQHLSDAIANINMTTPLINEKIEYEVTIINRIQAAQNDVDVLLRKAKDKLADTQEQSRSAYNRAAKEREQIAADLANTKRELNRAKKRLQDAIQVYEEYLAIIDKCSKKIEENTKSEASEKLRKDELIANHESLVEKNGFITRERFHVQKEIERVTNENQKKNEEIEAMSKKFKEELDKLYKKLAEKTEKLEKILKKVQEKKVDLDEMAKDKDMMENKMAKEERNRDRLIGDRTKVEEELRSTIVSFSNAMTLANNTVTDQDKAMKRMEAREDMLSKQIVELRKQIGDERLAIGQIVARLSSEVEDYNKAIEAHEQRKTQFEAKKKELDKKLADLEKKVAEIESRKILLENEVADLTKKLNDLLAEHAKIESELTNRINELEPKHQEDSEEYETNKNRVNYIKTHTIKMNDELVEMADSKKMMLKAMDKMNHDIEGLNEIFLEVTTQREHAGYLDSLNRTSLQNAEDRLKNSEKNHKNQMEDRRKYLENLNQQLKDYLNINKELASRYRFFKYYIYNRKISMMRAISLRLDSYFSVTDQMQIKSLQERMHNALKDYFNFKIRYSENNYFSLNDEKNKVYDEIENIEGSLNNSCDYITNFLNNQMDFGVLRQQAIQKAYKQELIEKQQQQQQQQQQGEIETGKNGKGMLQSITKTETNLAKKNKSVGFNLVNVA